MPFPGCLFSYYGCPLSVKPAFNSGKSCCTVDQFYPYEQESNFSGSWKLFHQYMKEKFPKAAYIQDRSHVFIGHFGAETFSYEISEAEELNGWKAARGEKPFKAAFFGIGYLVCRWFKEGMKKSSVLIILSGLYILFLRNGTFYQKIWESIPNSGYIRGVVWALLAIAFVI